MDLRKEISEFLTSRRARISPESAGLPSYSENRRVAGLRREELAMLAGVSVDYYTKIERGQLKGVSEPVIAGLARVLKLDDAERVYFDNLVKLSNPGIRSSGRSKPSTVRPSLQLLLDSIDAFPAYVRNGRLDILAANAMAKRFLSPIFTSQTGVPNMARFCLLDPAAQQFYVDWEEVATGTVGILRAHAISDPYDKQLTDLIGELSTRSEFFRVKWASNHVFEHKTGIKRFEHPEIGRLDLVFQGLDLPDDKGLRLNTYFAEPQTPTENGLKLLNILVNESRTQEDAAF